MYSVARSTKKSYFQAGTQAPNLCWPHAFKEGIRGGVDQHVTGLVGILPLWHTSGRTWLVRGHSRIQSRQLRHPPLGFIPPPSKKTFPIMAACLSCTDVAAFVRPSATLPDHEVQEVCAVATLPPRMRHNGARKYWSTHRRRGVGNDL